MPSLLSGSVSHPGKYQNLALTTAQLEIIQQPIRSKVFLEGPWGCGKTTTGIERLLYLMAQGVPGDSILLLTPQRTLAQTYKDVLDIPGVICGGNVSLITFGGLAQRMVSLFWPLIAEQAGFANPTDPPTFLTLETAQYNMAYLVRPLLIEGYFSSVTVEPNRIYSQVLDNLNKAAVVGFEHTEIGSRLRAIGMGDPAKQHIFEDAQKCATKFRQYCLAHNLLDFSLQVEVFRKFLWPLPQGRDYLFRSYHHLIMDNLEEDTPVAHDLLRDWLPHFDSALLIYDREAGFRSFLGADVHTGYALKEQCEINREWQGNFVASSGVEALRTCLGLQFNSNHNGRSKPKTPPIAVSQSIHRSLGFQFHQYFPQMLDWVIQETDRLIHEEQVRPGEIVILAPYLPDSSLYAIMDRFQRAGIPTRSHRPSRSIRDEPLAQCLLALAELAHPEWNTSPSPFEIANLLTQVIEGLDCVRANLLSELVYPSSKTGAPRRLVPVPVKNQALLERIGFRFIQKVNRLQEWLNAYLPAPGEDLDHFWRRLFDEVLSRDGFTFHSNPRATEVAANLIESVRKFRLATGRALEEDGKQVGPEYIRMVQEGVISAQYLRSWDDPEEDSVLVAPGYSFLMRNKAARFQFWLNVSSDGWSERLYQPLTNPYVLSREWPLGRPWTYADEEDVIQTNLSRLALGLLSRCQDRLYLGWSNLNEQGREETGRLLHAFQRLMKHMSRPDFSMNN